MRSTTSVAAIVMAFLVGALFVGVSKGSQGPNEQKASELTLSLSAGISTRCRGGVFQVRMPIHYSFGRWQRWYKLRIVGSRNVRCSTARFVGKKCVLGEKFPLIGDELPRCNRKIPRAWTCRRAWWPGTYAFRCKRGRTAFTAVWVGSAREKPHPGVPR